MIYSFESVKPLLFNYFVKTDVTANRWRE